VQRFKIHPFRSSYRRADLSVPQFCIGKPVKCYRYWVMYISSHMFVSSVRKIHQQHNRVRTDRFPAMDPADLFYYSGFVFQITGFL